MPPKKGKKRSKAEDEGVDTSIKDVDAVVEDVISEPVKKKGKKEDSSSPFYELIEKDTFGKDFHFSDLKNKVVFGINGRNIECYIVCLIVFLSCVQVWEDQERI